MTDVTDKIRSFSLDFPRAYGEPLGSGKIRAEPEDFQVEEILGFEPSGSGEHHLVQLRKQSCNTEWLARQMANFCGVRVLDIGYCGLKDRQAVTTQWFSVYAPKVDTFAWSEWLAQLPDPVTLLASGKHTRKLKRGGHSGNRFKLLIRDFVAESTDVAARMQLIGTHGVPNYFGIQRFGSNGNNLHAAEAWANKVRLDRRQRSFAMSAARAYLFNLVVARRVADATWHTHIAGDSTVDGAPTGPLWGRGRSVVTDAARALEDEVLADYETWKLALEHCGLTQARRSLAARPGNLTYRLLPGALEIEFTLGPGEFATTVLRELVDVDSASQVAAG